MARAAAVTQPDVTHRDEKDRVVTVVKAGLIDLANQPLYPAVPELKWLRDMADQFLGRLDIAHEQGETMMNLYKYLLWSRRYQLIPSGFDRQGSQIAYGFLTKYHRLVYGLPVSRSEQEDIDRAHKQHKHRLAAWRALNHG